MTAWLVDTHALLWFVTDDRQLSQTAREIMESGESILVVSAACLWEISIKASVGKLTVPDDLLAALHEESIDELPVSTQHAMRVAALPLGAHKDPFDRMLVAQALVERLPIISSDAQLDQYGVERAW